VYFAPQLGQLGFPSRKAAIAMSLPNCATVIDRPFFAGVISAIIFLWYKADMAITLNDTQKVEPALEQIELRSVPTAVPA
jgi:hypothetical protein